MSDTREFSEDDVEWLVRAVAPSGSTMATYGVLNAAARGALDMTTRRVDGRVHREDALVVLRKALEGRR